MTEHETNEVRNIQIKCLEILEIIDNICKRHNIKYSLCGGSVVGA
ncbi:MAG TPA: LicD family protein, partial [Terrisporobacter glycolicus]|nr:LicD family protein [Terrisporobacter hibernicus]